MLGSSLGILDGAELGERVGICDGVTLGVVVGLKLGAWLFVGTSDGATLG